MPDVPQQALQGGGVKRRLENAYWCTRLDHMRSYQMVKAHADDLVISFFPGNKRDGFSLSVSRKDARLLAKRINQCLDATVKK